MRESRITRFVPWLAIGLLSLAAPNYSLGQEDETFEEEDELEIVVVTGTRIKRRDFESISPLTTIGKQDFEFSGQPTLEEYLNQMPQLQPDFGRTSNNPGDGTAGLNLRGLGAGRTLVLLNGRRIAPSGVGSAVDVNNLPGALMDRVEIITGGASTVYGSDAISGVVNFITRDAYEGLSVDASYNVTAEGDSDIYDANIIYGHNLASGRGNITVYAGYYDREPLLTSQRTFTNTTLVDDLDTGRVRAGGSPIIPGGGVAFPLVDLGGGPDYMTWNPDGTPRVFADEDFYDFGPINYLQIPLERSTVGVMAKFDIFDRFEAYLEAAWTRNEAVQQLAEPPAVGFFLVNTDNPVLTPETRQVMEEQMLVAPGLAGMFFIRRMLELGPRIIDSTRDYTRLVTGFRGEFAEGWELDAWFTYTDASETMLFLNDGSISRLQQGLLVNPATGQCFDPSGGCVPLDVFGEGRMSVEGADFVRVPPLVNTADREQMLASVVVTGAPFEWWAGPVDMAFGAEWRSDEAHFKADDILFANDSMGYGWSSPVDGTESVWELYSEALIPIVDDRASGHHLGAELGARYSDYDNAGGVWTWKAGLDWRPTDSLRFRAMTQHSVRAPNNSELFTEQLEALGWAVNNPLADPCSASTDPVGNGMADKCVIQGLPASQVGIFEAEAFYPATFIVGGNPDLAPEESDTLTAGVVFTPSATPGLTLAVDYFEIEVTDTIGNISAFEICFDPKNTGHVFCENLQRDASGNIAEVFEPLSNRGLLKAKGVDSQLQYRRDLSPSLALFDGDARMNFSVLWTHLLSWEDQENVVTEVNECTGLFGSPCNIVTGGAFPENRVTGNVDYESGPMNIHLTWRWIDGMRSARPLTTPYQIHPDPKLAVPTSSSRIYFDLGLGYRFSDSVRARFGINNLFDKEPPLLLYTGPNTDTGYFDIFGRTYYLSFGYEL